MIRIYTGDISRLSTDAIVNAANTSLLGGGGVDGAIHRAAGPALAEECRKLNGCKTGEAKITSGYNLPAKFVIHTVGPVWQGGKGKENELLKCCYENSLKLAQEHDLRSIAFPAISTGRYAFPYMAAAEIAVDTVINFAEENSTPEEIIFVCFDEEMARIYKGILASR